jgi:hypothetical protein
MACAATTRPTSGFINMLAEREQVDLQGPLKNSALNRKCETFCRRSQRKRVSTEEGCADNEECEEEQILGGYIVSHAMDAESSARKKPHVGSVPTIEPEAPAESVLPVPQPISAVPEAIPTQAQGLRRTFRSKFSCWTAQKVLLRHYLPRLDAPPSPRTSTLIDDLGGIQTSPMWRQFLRELERDPVRRETLVGKLQRGYRASQPQDMRVYLRGLVPDERRQICRPLFDGYERWLAGEYQIPGGVVRPIPRRPGEVAAEVGGTRNGFTPYQKPVAAAAVEPGPVLGAEVGVLGAAAVGTETPITAEAVQPGPVLDAEVGVLGAVEKPITAAAVEPGPVAAEGIGALGAVEKPITAAAVETGPVAAEGIGALGAVEKPITAAAVEPGPVAVEGIGALGAAAVGRLIMLLILNYKYVIEGAAEQGVGPPSGVSTGGVRPLPVASHGVGAHAEGGGEPVAAANTEAVRGAVSAVGRQTGLQQQRPPVNQPRKQYEEVSFEFALELAEEMSKDDQARPFLGSCSVCHMRHKDKFCPFNAGNELCLDVGTSCAWTG